MKKLFVTISICFFAFTGFLKALPTDYYQTSSNEVLYCKKLNPDKEHINVVLENGKSFEVPATEVKMYCRNGKIYEKLPVYLNNKETGKEGFMQFISTRAGLKLYKYSVKGESARYYVFKGDQFWSEVNDQNYGTTMNFFGAN